MHMTEIHSNLPSGREGAAEFLLLTTGGEVLSHSESAAEAADLLAQCLENIPPGHPTPGLYLRKGAQCVAVTEAWAPEAAA